MKTALIAIGSELLDGKIIDKNTQYLGKRLTDLGHNLSKVIICGDEKEELTKLIQSLKDYTIFISGGLGPTLDDITKPMLCELFKEELSESEAATQITLTHFERGNRDYDKSVMHYHLMPESFTPLLNPVGYAPGIYINQDEYEIFSLPGVPAEFQEMLEQSIFPVWFEDQNDRFIKNVIVKTWKVPESKIFHELAPNLWKKLEEFGPVSSLPHSGGVDIGVKLNAKSREQLLADEKEVLKLINSTPIKDFIWHIGPELLEEVIVMKAKEKGLTIGFSESCTGGLLASRITDISGSSSVFWGSVVSYSNEVKIKSLNVSEQTLKDYGAVSEQTAFEMAQGARKHLEVDIAVSTTGIAGPGGATPGKPVGTVGIGVSTKHKTESKIYHFRGNRLSLKQRFSQAALFKMLEAIIEA